MKEKIIATILLFLIFISFSTTVLAAGSETPSGIPLTVLEDFVDEYMAQYIGITSPGAAVVLVKDGKIILSKGYGYADLENRIAVDPTLTIFEYGSVSKLFVYTTLMRLSEAGKLDLYADIRQYLPEGFLRTLRYNEPITLLHIMNHTAGFEDNLFSVLLSSPEDLPTLEEAVRILQPEQVYQPGKVSAYSNYAVALAAYICEQIIGQDYHAYIKEMFFAPLGMNHTSAHPTLIDIPRLTDSKAIGYHARGDGTFKPGDWSYVPLYPAGSVNGTAEDLARFAMAFMPDRDQKNPLFSKKDTLDEMFIQSHAMGPGMTGFSHGFIEWDGEYRGLGHGGNTIAFTAQLNIVPEERFGVIILTNASNELEITSGLTEALIGKRVKPVPTSSDNLPSAHMVEGTYISARRMHYGFLKLYNYLQLLQVKAIDYNLIELKLAGQTSQLVQTHPYLYERVKANGPIFDHHFGTIYFHLGDEGSVQKMSGDFLPVSSMTLNILYGSLVIVILYAAYTLVSLIALFIGFLHHKQKDTKLGSKQKTIKRHHTVLLISGATALVNNAVLIIRMLINNYRSFSEVMYHILLNYPLVALSVINACCIFFFWKKADMTLKQKTFYGTTIAVTCAFYIVLAGWDFFRLLN